MLQPVFLHFPELTTNNLLLRKISLDDAGEILNLRNNEQVMQFIDKEKAVTIKDAEAFINRILQSLDNNDGITWAITYRDEPGTLIGTIGYWRIIKDHYRSEIGYMLHPQYWKKGIMNEALEKVIDYGFNELGLHSIEAHINPSNSASSNILLRNGFVKEAHFKENFYFNGSFRDTIIYSKLNKP